MNKPNFQKELEAILDEIRTHMSESDPENVPRLLLHSCCAPCSSYVLEYLSEYFQITDFFYNPNIEPESEYHLREEELKRLIREMNPSHPISFVSGTYDAGIFHHAVRGLEQIPEGGERCFACYRLRMEEAAAFAAKGGYDYFTTTLSISPLKNADRINQIGKELEERYGVKHLPSDFKKKGGYQRSIVLSKEYGLYRQDYCGCIYSKAERMKQKEKSAQMAEAAKTVQVQNRI